MRVNVKKGAYLVRVDDQQWIHRIALSMLKGIGPVNERKLNEHGIFRRYPELDERR